MTNYYVKTGGNDGLSGLDLANAWATVNKAATTPAGDDTVWFDNGTWTFTGQSSWNSGTAGHIITFRAINPGQVTWQLSGANILTTFTGETYITIKNIVLRGAGATSTNALVRIDGCTEVILDTCELTNTDANGVRLAGLCTNVRVTGCTIHPELVRAGAEKDGISCALMTAGSTATFDNNEIYHCAHNGIYAGDDITVTEYGNDIHDNGSHNLAFGDTPGDGNASGEVYDNDLWNAGAWNEVGTKKSGVFISTNIGTVNFRRNRVWHCTGPAVQLHDNLGAVKVYLNVGYDCQTGTSTGEATAISTTHADAAAPGTIDIKDNIFYQTNGSPKNMFYSSWNVAMGGKVTVANNLYYTTGGYERMVWFGTTYTSFASYKGAVEPTAVIGQDPGFTSLVTPDFHLQNVSPAIDAGAVVSPYTDGYLGSAPDIGAYEYVPAGGGGGGGGMTWSTPPPSQEVLRWGFGGNPWG